MISFTVNINTKINKLNCKARGDWMSVISFLANKIKTNRKISQNKITLPFHEHENMPFPMLRRMCKQYYCCLFINAWNFSCTLLSFSLSPPLWWNFIENETLILICYALGSIAAGASATSAHAQKIESIEKDC